MTVITIQPLITVIMHCNQLMMQADQTKIRQTSVEAVRQADGHKGQTERRSLCFPSESILFIVVDADGRENKKRETTGRVKFPPS